MHPVQEYPLLIRPVARLRLPVSLAVCVVAGLMGTVSCDSSGHDVERVQRAEPCSLPDRSEPGWRLSNANISIGTSGGVPCSLRFDSVAVLAWPVADTQALQLRAVKAVLNDGTMLLSSYSAGELWRADVASGTLTRVARSGGGPGELRGALTVHVGAADSFAVRDDAIMWHRFTSAGVFVDAQSARAVGGLRSETCSLSNGSLITTAYVGPESPAVRSVGFDLRLLSAFDLSHLPALGSAGSPVGRRVWCGVGNYAFFVEHPTTRDALPALVLWAPVTRRYARVELALPWFVPGPLVSGTGALARRPPSEFREVADLGGGVVLLVVRVNDPRWQPMATRRDQRAAYDQLLDLRYVVVDLDDSSVLAELLVDTVSTAPVDFLPNAGASYSLDQALDSVRIWRIRPFLSPLVGS